MEDADADEVDVFPEDATCFESMDEVLVLLLLEYDRVHSNPVEITD
jgi:hypothetical protein